MQRGAFNLTLAGVKPEYSFSSVILKTKNERTGTHIWQHRRSFNEAVCRGALRSWACLFGCCFFSILLWYIFGIVRWLNQCYLFQKKDYFCLFFSQKQLCPKLWWATPRLVVISWHHKDELKQEQRQSRDSQTFVKGRPLTILPVVGDLHLALLGPEHGVGDLADGLFAGQLAVEEVAGAGLLHDVRSGEPRHLAEAIVTVDDCTVLHSGIGYDKFPVCMKTNIFRGVFWPAEPHNQVDQVLNKQTKFSSLGDIKFSKSILDTQFTLRSKHGAAYITPTFSYTTPPAAPAEARIHILTLTLEFPYN